MKCLLKRCKINDKNEKIIKGYFSKYLGFNGCKIHWVQDRQEAKLFKSVKEARDMIRINKIKNVEVEKI